jgi:Flp pilus assembly protein TadD
LPEHDDATRARAHRDRSEVALGLGRFAQAETEARAALALGADDRDALILLARAQLGLGRMLDAEGAARSAVQRAPRDGYARYILGFVLQVSGKHGDAEVELREAVALHPHSKRFYTRLAIALCELGRRDEGRKIVDDLEPLSSEDPQFLDECARVYCLSGAHDPAEQCARRALQVRPADPAAHWRLSWVLAAGMRLEQSAEHATDALRIDPNFIAAWEELGAALFALGVDDEAEPVLCEALRLRPDSRSSALKLASLYARNGRDRRAERVCDRFLARRHHDAGLAELRERLREGRRGASRDRLRRAYLAISLCAWPAVLVLRGHRLAVLGVSALFVALALALPSIFRRVEQRREGDDDAPPPAPRLWRRSRPTAPTDEPS